MRYLARQNFDETPDEDRKFSDINPNIRECNENTERTIQAQAVFSEYFYPYSRKKDQKVILLVLFSI
jgi:hypothetical protein